MKATIYHNTKCSKSNAALNLLLERGIETDIVNYLDTPLSTEALEGLLKLLGLEARQIIRFNEPIANELSIAIDDSRNESEWLSLLADNPILIERPIVVVNGKAVIGRPAERVLELLQNV